MAEIIPRMDIIKEQSTIESVKPVNRQIIGNALTKPKNEQEKIIQKSLKKESTFERTI